MNCRPLSLTPCALAFLIAAIGCAGSPPQVHEPANSQSISFEPLPSVHQPSEPAEPEQASDRSFDPQKFVEAQTVLGHGCRPIGTIRLRNIPTNTPCFEGLVKIGSLRHNLAWVVAALYEGAEAEATAELDGQGYEIVVTITRSDLDGYNPVHAFLAVPGTFDFDQLSEFASGQLKSSELVVTLRASYAEVKDNLYPNIVQTAIRNRGENPTPWTISTVTKLEVQDVTPGAASRLHGEQNCTLTVERDSSDLTRAYMELRCGSKYEMITHVQEL